MILFQEAESHFDDTNIATEQFHVYQGADQLIVLRKSTFEPDVSKTEEVIPDMSKQGSFGLKYLIVRSMFRRTPKHGQVLVTHPPLFHVSNTTAKRRGMPKMLSGQFRENTELNDVDIIWRSPQHFGLIANAERRSSSIDDTRGELRC